MTEERGKVKIVTLRRTQFIEMGKDLFDKRVSETLQRIGEENIIATHPVSYEHVDMTTLQTVMDYGLIVIYREPEG
ncbi:hypothetical protein HQ563_12955 [bacterium]|nr:hypothetical protein [bacterium]